MEAATPLPKLAEIGEVVAGKYRIDAVLGQGGMGAVFVGTHQITGKRFAIKMLLPHVARDAMVAQRFVQEAQASARIAHRNVVEVLDVGDWNGALYLVMELLVGESLTSYLERHGPMSLGETMALLTRILRGLEAAHQNGIIHRDLKPDNIFLCADDSGEPLEPKIVDFGIAKVTDSAAARGTATGTGMGTAFYMPLEQMMGAKNVTPAADIYSMAVVTYECLAGRLPYEADTLPALVMKMHEHPPAPIDSIRADLPKGLSAALMRALANQPADRPQSVAEFADSLRPFGFGDASLPLPRPQVSKLPSGSGSSMNSGEVLAAMSANAVGSAPTLQSGSIPKLSEIRVKAGGEPEAPPSRSVVMPILAAVGVAAIGAGAAVFFLRSTPAPTPPPVPAPIVVAAPPPAPVQPAGPTVYRVTVRTGTRAARLLSAGLELGATPTEVELQAESERTFDVVSEGMESAAWTLRVTPEGAIEAASGDQRRRLAVSSDRRATLDLQLAPAPSDSAHRPRPAPTAAPAPAPVAAPPPPPPPPREPEPERPPPRPPAPALAPR